TAPASPLSKTATWPSRSIANHVVSIECAAGKSDESVIGASAEDEVQVRERAPQGRVVERGEGGARGRVGAPGDGAVPADRAEPGARAAPGQAGHRLEARGAGDLGDLGRRRRLAGVTAHGQVDDALGADAPVVEPERGPARGGELRSTHQEVDA